jgi:hypothetical protein
LRHLPQSAENASVFLMFALDKAVHLLKIFLNIWPCERSHSAGSLDVRTQIYRVKEMGANTLSDMVSDKRKISTGKSNYSESETQDQG